ncbi:hypothetical protein ACFL6C_02815 [Myxococcota bacterium]
MAKRGILLRVLLWGPALVVIVALLGVIHVLSLDDPRRWWMRVTDCPFPDSFSSGEAALTDDDLTYGFGDELEPLYAPRFAHALRSMREPDITRWPGAPVYRFLWLRSFQPAIVVRATLGPSNPVVVAKQMGKGGCVLGRLCTRVERNLRDEEAQRLRDCFATAHTWRPTNDDRRGLDGATWVIEMKAQDGYRIFNYWSPEKGELRECALTMLKMVGMPQRPWIERVNRSRAAAGIGCCRTTGYSRSLRTQITTKGLDHRRATMVMNASDLLYERLMGH